MFINYLFININILAVPFAFSPNYRYPVNGVLLAMVLITSFIFFFRRRTKKFSFIRRKLSQQYLKHLLFGSGFFLVATIPALYLKNRFEPYYTSLAAVGMSIFIATLISLLDMRWKTRILVSSFILAALLIIGFRLKGLSHAGRGQIAMNAVEDIGHLIERSEWGGILFIAGADKYLIGALGTGCSVKLYFPTVREVHFDVISSGFQPNKNDLCLEYKYNHLVLMPLELD